MIYRVNRQRPMNRGGDRCSYDIWRWEAQPGAVYVCRRAAAQQANETTFETGSLSVESSELHAIAVRSGSVGSGTPQADHWRSALGQLDE